MRGLGMTKSFIERSLEPVDILIREMKKKPIKVKKTDRKEFLAKKQNSLMF